MAETVMIVATVLCGCLQEGGQDKTMNTTITLTRGDMYNDAGKSLPIVGPGRMHWTFEGKARNSGHRGYATIRVSILDKNGSVLGAETTRIHLKKNQERGFVLDFTADITAMEGQHWSEVLREPPFVIEVSKQEPD